MTSSPQHSALLDMIIKDYSLLQLTTKTSDAFHLCMLIHTSSGALKTVILPWHCRTLAGQQDFLANNVA